MLCPLLPLCLTPEPRSQGCWAALSPVPRGDSRGRESGHSFPGGPCGLAVACLHPGAHISQTEDAPKSPGEAAAPSDLLSCCIQACWSTASALRRAGRFPFSQCVLGSDLPARSAWIAGRREYRERGPSRVRCLHPGVVLILSTLVCPTGPGFGNCTRRKRERDLFAPFNLLHLRCCPPGATATAESCIWTWAAG